MAMTRFIRLWREAAMGWKADKASRLGAALAYYAIFSLAPLLLMAIGLASLAFEEEAARGEVVSRLQDAVGQPAAEFIEAMLRRGRSDGGGLLATGIGLALALFGASGVFIQFQDALNTIWKAPPPSAGGIWRTVKKRLLSFVLVIGTGILLLASLAMNTVLTALSSYVSTDALPGGNLLWEALHGLVALGFLTTFLAMIYKLLPDVPIGWRDVWIGALVTACLFTIGKYAIGIYLALGSTTSVFGAASSLVAILLWIYYSSQIFLFGAEFTRVHAVRRRSSTGGASPEGRETDGPSSTLPARRREQPSGASGAQLP